MLHSAQMTRQLNALEHVYYMTIASAMPVFPVFIKQ